MDELPPRPVTLREVADAAGVSIATASRALSGRGDLANETREVVADAAERLGYHKTSAPRGRTATHDPRLIEFVLGSFDDAWTNAVTAGAREAAFRLGFDLVLTLERSDPMDDWPLRVATRRPSGVVLGIIRPTSQQLAEIRGLRIPIVLLEPRADPDGELPSVGTTDWQGGHDAGVHLADTGYERFVVLTGEPRYRFGRAREAGFRAGVAEVNPDATVRVVGSQWTAAPVTSQLLDALAVGPDGPVGVFGCNDEMALSVYRACARLGVRIPDDVGVIGFNDEPRARMVTPALTSIRQPLQAMAARAVEMIGLARAHEELANARVELPTELIVRGSTL